jgi:glycosyltransferase involved in cell wall biosynthesis
MKKISVIIPMYKVEKYIEKCIGSVFNQGLNENDFEIVIVDDQSPDNSLAVAQELTSAKSNVTIISQGNKGLGGARNTGVLNATGTYLLFLDSDDWLLPNVLEKLLQIAETDDLDVLEFAAQGVSVTGDVTYVISKSSPVLNSGFDYYNTIRYMNSACNKLYKRTFLLQHKLFFLERIFIEDFEFNTRAFAQLEKVRATTVVGAQFLQSPNSITRNTDAAKKEKMVKDIILVLQKTKECSQIKGAVANKNATTFFNERISFIVVTLFIQLLKNKNSFLEIKQVRQQLRDQGLYGVNHKVFDRKKNLFRIVLLKNFLIFRFVHRILRWA